MSRPEGTPRQVGAGRRLALSRDRLKWLYLALGGGSLVLFALSLWQLDIRYASGWASFAKAASFAGRMLQFDVTDWRDVLYSALQSISVAILATIISAALAFIVSFFAAANLVPRAVPVIIRSICAAIRAVPTLIWALIFVAFLGLGPFAGVLGLCFHSFAYLVKAFSQAIEEVPAGSLEALRATGASWLQVAARGVLPSIRTALISWTALRFEINVGQSSILGLVGAGGIGHDLSLAMRMFDFEKAGFVLLIIFAMSYGIEMLFHKLKINVDRSRRR